MAGKKRIKRRTYKKIIAKAMALSMCISIFQPGGTGIVAYAAEETNNSIVHSWDFEDGMQDWEISGWESPSMGDSAVSHDLGKLKLSLDFSGKFNDEEGNKNDWVKAGVKTSVIPENVYDGADKILFDFYYDSNAKSTGELAIQASAQANDNWDDVLANGNLDITNNDNLPVENMGNGMVKKTVSFDLDKVKANLSKAKSMVLVVIGRETDYSGDVYFDNIRIVKSGTTDGDTSVGVLYDFEDSTEQDWGVSGWTLEDMKSSMVVANESGRLKVNLDYKGKNDNGNTNWLQAGIQQNNLSGVSFAGTDTLSFDFWYKSDSKTTGSLSLKVVAESDAGNAVISDTIAVTDNENLSASELDDNWKKVNLSFKMDESKTGTTVKDFMLLVVGQDTDYAGDVYFDNIKVYKSDTTEGDIPSEILYDFEENQPEGWDVSDWDFKEAIKLSNELQRLKAELDFSDKLSNGWAQAGIEQTELSGVDFAGKNCITFDFYYNDQYKSAGNFTIKAVVEADVNGSSKSIISSDCLDVTSNNELPEEKLEDGWTKKKLTFDLDEIQAATVPATRLVFLVVGRNTDYKGTLYFDNIRIFKSSPEDKGYVNSTVEIKTATSISGTNNSLTVNGEQHKYTESIKLADEKADAGTVALYQYLKAVGNSSSVIYGHMEDTVLKAGSSSLPGYSDTEDVTGSISAIDGLDCGGLFTGFADKFASRYPDEAASLGISNDDTTAEDDIKAAAAFSNKSIEAGAIMTLSAHMPNFAYSVKKDNADSIGKTYDQFDYTVADSYTLTGDCVNNILPGGKFNEAYTAYLDLIAEYASLVNGTVLFRPLHENTGGWFWWGSTFCTADTYKSVFKYTVDYLRDEKNVHNFLYLYGPGSEAASEAEYEERYPGDGYVDLVGFDSYDNNPDESANYTFQDNFRNTIRLTDAFAKKHNKLFAVTETGIANGSKALLPSGNKRKNWYKEILDIVTDSEFDCCYFMLWSNYSSSGSYYTPFVVKDNGDGTLCGHEMLDPFITFYNDAKSIFASDQKNVLSGISVIEKPVIAERELDGYITAPVASNRILEPLNVTARLNMATDKDISIRISGNGKDINLETQKDGTGKIYNALITKENLADIGETLQGRIGLYADDAVLQEISVIFNIKEKELEACQVDDFEIYGGLSNLLANKWSTNKDSGCTIDISLVNEPRYEGDYALKFVYNKTKTGWGGATISKEADWSGYNALRFWVKPDGKNQKTVIQINAGGGSYEAYLDLYDEYTNADTPLLVTLPFSEFKDKSGGAPLGGEALKNISQFGLWVNAIPDSDAFADGAGTVSGVLYYDDIRAVSVDTDKPVFEKTSDIPSTEPTATPEPTVTPEPTKKPSSFYPSYIGTQPPATQAPAATQTPGPAGTQAPAATQTPEPAVTQTPTVTPELGQTPGTTTEIIKDEATGSVKEITTTVSDGNIIKVVEKTTMPDGTQSIKETVTETLNGVVNITETYSRSETNAVLVKSIKQYTDGNVISAEAVIYTGISEINSDYSAKNIIPLSFMEDAKNANINSITICVEKPTVDAVKANKGRKMVIKVKVPHAEGISVGKVMLTAGSIASATESNRKLVVKFVNDDKKSSYTVTIPQSELKKMKDDIDITVNAGKIAVMDKDKQKNIKSILSSNKINTDNACVISTANNNTKGGIKVSVPVMEYLVKPGDNVYVYCYNNKTGKLEETANSKRKVLSGGMAGIEAYSGNDYVITNKELSGKNVVTLLGSTKVKAGKVSIKKGGETKINVVLPAGLVSKTSLKKDVPYGKQAAVIQYKSSGTKVAKVSKDGTVKASGTGKAVITVKIKLADGKVKTVKKKITVK